MYPNVLEGLVTGNAGEGLEQRNFGFGKHGLSVYLRKSGLVSLKKL